MRLRPCLGQWISFHVCSFSLVIPKDGICPFVSSFCLPFARQVRPARDLQHCQLAHHHHTDRLRGNAVGHHLQATRSGFDAGRRVLRALKSSDTMAIESVALDCTLAIGPRSWVGARKLRVASAHAKRINRACEAVVAGLAEDHSLTSTAREVGMNTFYFARVFRELVGQPPHQYLLRARLAHAARMLRKEASVTEAAVSSGFGNLSHFTRTFRSHFGVAPIQYTKRGHLPSK
jgi:AraC-like DNA-binding protein